MAENSIAPNLMCVVMRNGVELWISPEKADRLRQVMETMTESKFVTITGTFGERTVNTADVTGIFTPQDIEETKRRKNGEWKCQFGKWHDRKQLCNHEGEQRETNTYQEIAKPRTSEEQERINHGLAGLRQQKDKILGKVSMK